MSYRRMRTDMSTRVSAAKEETKWRHISILVCGKCNYLEFPGCTRHKHMLTRSITGDSKYSAVKGLQAMACTLCSTSTDTSTPFSVSCRQCKKQRAMMYPVMINKKETLRVKKLKNQNKRTCLLRCTSCSATQFVYDKTNLNQLVQLDKRGRVVAQGKSSARLPVQVDEHVVSFSHFSACSSPSIDTISIKITQDEIDYLIGLFSVTPFTPPTVFNADMSQRQGDIKQGFQGHLRISEHLNEICFSDKFSDCSFMVRQSEDQKGEGVIVRAHKTILAARSGYFAGMFFGGFSESTNSEHIPIVFNPQIFQAMIQFIYTDDVPLATGNVKRFLQVANLFDVPSLVRECARFFTFNITEYDACTYYSICPADVPESEAILKYIDSHASEVMASPSFAQLPVHRVIKIIERDTLDISEVNLFRKLHRWAAIKNEHDAKSQSLHDIFAPLLQYIRFPRMTADSLARVVVPTGLLSAEVLNELFKYHGSGKALIDHMSEEARTRHMNKMKDEEKVEMKKEQDSVFNGFTHIQFNMNPRTKEERWKTDR